MKRNTLFLILTLMAFTSINAQNKPYITKVYDFMPAPGQFVNDAPMVDEPISKDSVLRLVEEMLCGYEKSNGKAVVDPGLISLGSYGGYVVFGFDHPVVNVRDSFDIQIIGNAIQGDATTSAGGSSEPGIVMVSRDENGNGIPDDPWYELAGSEYNNPRTQKGFKITYYRPDENKIPVPDPNDPFHVIVDMEYIRWTCNSVDSLQEGYVRKNSFHNQSYWPRWIDSDEITFEGNKLPCNAVDESGDGSYWIQHFYDWGYVDNRPDWFYGYKKKTFRDYMNLGFKIDWAVDDEGNHVHLRQIDFVKVYNGILQDCGRLGETSTEVCGAFDLHPDAEPEPDPMPEVGDVNNDNSVNAADVTALYRFILNGDDTFISTSDVNEDGSVNAADVTAVYKIILGNER